MSHASIGILLHRSGWVRGMTLVDRGTEPGFVQTRDFRLALTYEEYRESRANIPELSREGFSSNKTSYLSA